MTEALPAARSRSRAVPLVLGALMVATAVILLDAGRGLNFYRDEWAYIQLRREWTFDALLGPHGDHLVRVPALRLKTLFATAGITQIWPYQATIVAFHLLTTGLVFTYARGRLDDGPALAAALLVLLLGSGWENLIVGVQVGYVIPVAAAIGMLLAFDRRDRAGEIVASALIGLALASQAVGLALIVPACLEILARPGRLGRLWIVAAPLSLYLLWWFVYQPGVSSDPDFFSKNLAAAPGFVARSAVAGVGGLTGLGVRDYDVLALVGALLLVGLLVVRRRASQEPLIPLRVASIAALTFSFLSVLALGRALASPFTSRYVYVTAVFIVLLGVELARGVRLSAPWLAPLALLVVLAAWGNYGLFRDGIRELERFESEVGPKVAALEIAGPRTSPGFAVGERKGQWAVALVYFPAVEDFGSPADSPAELLRRPPRERMVADETLVRALELRAERATAVRTGGPPPRVLTADGTVRNRRSCLVHRGGGALELVAPPTGILVSIGGGPPAVVRVRRFADQYREAPIATVSGSAAIQLPRARSTVPWRARVSGPARVRVCTLLR